MGGAAEPQSERRRKPLRQSWEQTPGARLSKKRISSTPSARLPTPATGAVAAADVERDADDEFAGGPTPLAVAFDDEGALSRPLSDKSPLGSAASVLSFSPTLALQGHFTPMEATRIVDGAFEAIGIFRAERAEEEEEEEEGGRVGGGFFSPKPPGGRVNRHVRFHASPEGDGHGDTTWVATMRYEIVRGGGDAAATPVELRLLQQCDDAEDEEAQEVLSEHMDVWEQASRSRVLRESLTLSPPCVLQCLYSPPPPPPPPHTHTWHTFTWHTFTWHTFACYFSACSSPPHGCPMLFCSRQFSPRDASSLNTVGA